MGKEILWDKIVWSDSDDFIAFAFGDFDSKAGGIVRVSNSNRYSNDISPPINDIMIDVPGADGAYYFGSTYKPKVFNVNFAFDNLSTRQLKKLKLAFDGKEIKELCFAEERNRIYMAKVTGQPNIKSICFDVNGEEIYKGEGSVQFTAYWPFARDIEETEYVITDQSIVLERTIDIENEGDIPTFITFTTETGVSQIGLKPIEVIVPIIETEDDSITYWDSKTGVVKSGNDLIKHQGDGAFLLPVGTTTIAIKNTKNTQSVFKIKFYNWYY